MDIHQSLFSFYLSSLLALSFINSSHASITIPNLPSGEKDAKHTEWLLSILHQRSDSTQNDKREKLIGECLSFARHTERDLELYTIEMLKETIRAEQMHLKAIELYQEMTGRKPSTFLSTATILRRVNDYKKIIRKLRT